jgi:hypothetical protein
MRGINHRQLLASWDAVLWKLCDDCTPHDCLGEIKRYLESSAESASASGLSPVKTQKAIALIQKAMALVDPEN